MKKNKKGFTLAELLVVVAIIAVLTAIAIPVFNSATEKSREAADIANVRTAYAEQVTLQLTDSKEYGSYNGPSLNYASKLTQWSVKSDGLHIKYDAQKMSDLSLFGGYIK